MNSAHHLLLQQLIVLVMLLSFLNLSISTLVTRQVEVAVWGVGIMHTTSIIVIQLSNRTITLQ